VQTLPQKPYSSKTGTSQGDDLSASAKFLYQAAFGRTADEGWLASHIQQLQAGISLETLAKRIVDSTEFKARNGAAPEVDRQYLTALYRDGLGREPDSEGLAHWLAKGKEGATRANILAAFAGSDEARKRVVFPSPGSEAPETATPPQKTSSPSRAEILLESIPRTARIIEIGPSFSPIAPKADGWRTHTLDHATRGALVEKYKGHPGVDVTRIEEVDFVWNGGPFIDAVSREFHGTFDAFIASHVIEHTPDFIAFLEAAEALLKPDGVVILAVPDKRYCFDYFQPLTTTGQILDAHGDRRSRHTRSLGFDHAAYVVKNGDTGAWGQHSTQGFTFFHTIDEARKLFDAIQASQEYMDIHAWRFTPSSFQLIIMELAALGESDWLIETVTDAIGCEFHVRLKRGGRAAAELTSAQLDARRLALLKSILLEIRVQSDWLLAGEPNLLPT
jgi:SAM-dependent methyltransferase